MPEATLMQPAEASVFEIYVAAHRYSALMPIQIAARSDAISRALDGLSPDERLMVAAFFILAEMGVRGEDMQRMSPQ